MADGQCNQNFRTEGSRMKPRHGDSVLQVRLRKIRFAKSNEKLLKDLKQPVYIYFVFFKDHLCRRVKDRLHARWQS